MISLPFAPYGTMYVYTGILRIIIYICKNIYTYVCIFTLLRTIYIIYMHIYVLCEMQYRYTIHTSMSAIRTPLRYGMYLSVNIRSVQYNTYPYLSHALRPIQYNTVYTYTLCNTVSINLHSVQYNTHPYLSHTLRPIQYEVQYTVYVHTIHRTPHPPRTTQYIHIYIPHTPYSII